VSDSHYGLWKGTATAVLQFTAIFLILWTCVGRKRALLEQKHSLEM